ncbi:MAG: exosortase-associated EpsI family protein [Phycisphaerae bacterium]|nr:exosortase-associated EpsI family protein [Phycisphaerae bacterium]
MSTSGAQARQASQGLGIVLRDSVRHPGFMIGVVTLAVMAVVFHGATRNVRLVKLAAPLRLSLTRLDKEAMAPYRFMDAQIIEPEVLSSLGTEQYIQWTLRDESVTNDADPTKWVHLFITYYTGQPDPVPHVPDKCFFGSGYLIKAAEDVEVDVPEVKEARVPIRVLEFEKKGRIGQQNPIVAYTFGANGTFAAGRNDVRMLLSNPFEPYSYFSKVEVHFGTGRDEGLSRPKVITATQKLFRVLLPLLVENHWPDWEALPRDTDSAGAATGESPAES